MVTNTVASSLKSTRATVSSTTVTLVHFILETTVVPNVDSMYKATTVEVKGSYKHFGLIHHNCHGMKLLKFLPDLE